MVPKPPAERHVGQVRPVRSLRVSHELSETRALTAGRQCALELGQVGRLLRQVHLFNSRLSVLFIYSFVADLFAIKAGIF